LKKEKFVKTMKNWLRDVMPPAKIKEIDLTRNGTGSGGVSLRPRSEPLRS
jgi:hypothetical protein